MSEMINGKMLRRKRVWLACVHTLCAPKSVKGVMKDKIQTSDKINNMNVGRGLNSGRALLQKMCGDFLPFHEKLPLAGLALRSVCLQLSLSSSGRIGNILQNKARGK